MDDGYDPFPANPYESVDTDGDGIGNNADPDDDNDGVLDADDAFPLDPTRSAHPAPDEVMVDLGTLGGGWTGAASINASGQVVGISETIDSQILHAFIWDAAGGMSDLGTLIGVGGYSSANAINDFGQVTGVFEAGMADVWVEPDEVTPGHYESRPYHHAFVWDPVHGMQDLGTLGGTHSFAFAINNAGQVVGQSYIAGDTETHAFIWSAAGGMQDLGTLGGGSSAAQGINNIGQVVGLSDLPGSSLFQGTAHAFIWDALSGMRDLGTLEFGLGGRTTSSATGINSNGQVIGWSATYGPPDPPRTTVGDQLASNAFIWESTQGMRGVGATSPGVYFKLAYAINSAGQVVGFNSGPVVDQAFVWDASNGLIELGTLGGGSSYATGINDSGQVVGSSQTAVGSSFHAFIVSLPPASTPLFANLSPASAPSGSGELELTINGAGFAAGTVVLWNDQELVPSSRTATQMQVTVPAALLQTSADLETVAIRVKAPTGQVSNSKAFTLLHNAGNVAAVQSAIVTAGEQVSVSIPPASETDGGISASLTHTGHGAASVSIAVYDEDPSPEGASFEVAGSFVDVNVGGAAPGDTMATFFYYSGDATGVVLRFYNQASGLWEDVTPVFNNTAQSRFEVLFDANSHPKITELTGTFFAAAILDQEPPVIACPNITVPCSVEPLVAVSYPPPTSLSDNIDSPSEIDLVYSIASGSGFPVGVTTVTCTATDGSGNTASSTFTVTRQPLGFTGFLAPLGGSDGSGGSSDSPLRTFKSGSTIPVKFTATCDGAPVLTGVHRLQVVKFSSSTLAGTPIDASPQDAATTGNAFRLADGVWHFNLDTKGTGVTTGIWEVRCTMSDGSRHSCWIQVK
ncbi:MAG: HYR domain-containing protein [Verrucomicrobiales bacterium]